MKSADEIRRTLDYGERPLFPSEPTEPVPPLSIPQRSPQFTHAYSPSISSVNLGPRHGLGITSVTNDRKYASLGVTAGRPSTSSGYPTRPALVNSIWNDRSMSVEEETDINTDTPPAPPPRTPLTHPYSQSRPMSPTASRSTISIMSTPGRPVYDELGARSGTAIKEKDKKEKEKDKSGGRRWGFREGGNGEHAGVWRSHGRQERESR